MGVATWVAMAAASCTSTVNTTGPGAGGNTGSDYGACQASPDCVVVPESCCGSCGAATRSDAVAINSDQSDAYRAAVCDDGQGCPTCHQDRDPSLIATCDAGQCTVVDIYELSLTDCQTADDCKLRAQRCCECEADTGRSSLISIRADAEAEYAALVCDPNKSCLFCAPIYPPETTAICTPDGTCQVSWPGPPE